MGDIISGLKYHLEDFRIPSQRIDKAIASYKGTKNESVLITELLTQPSGMIDGTALGLAYDGQDGFATAISKDFSAPFLPVREALASQISEFANSDTWLTGADVVALSLVRQGVKFVIGYPGTSELFVCDRIARCGQLKLINGRGDGECVFIAAGANLLLQEAPKAAALLHGARGGSNALGAIGSARRNEIPVICIVGLPATASNLYLPPHGELHLIQSLSAFAIRNYEMSRLAYTNNDQDFIKSLKELQSFLRTDSDKLLGPILLGLPQDVSGQPWIPWRTWMTVAEETTYIKNGSAWQPDSQEKMIADACKVLAESKRPVLFIDDFYYRWDLSTDALKQLSEQLCAPIFQISYRRGPMLFNQNAQHLPQFGGMYDPSNSYHRQALENADSILMLEERNAYPRVIGPIPGCLKIVITSNLAANKKNGYITEKDILLCGEVSQLLREIVNRLNSLDNKKLAYESPVISKTVLSGSPSRLHQLLANMCDFISQMGASAIIDDSQMFGGVIAECYDHLHSSRVHGDHSGFVGGGLGYAVGAALANPEQQIWCTVGDQGFANGFQSLVCAVEQNVRLRIIVCNNGGSVSLRKQALAEGLDLDMLEPSFLKNSAFFGCAEVATALGVHSRTIDLSTHIQQDANSEFLPQLLQEVDQFDGVSLLELILPSEIKEWGDVWAVKGVDEK